MKSLTQPFPGSTRLMFLCCLQCLFFASQAQNVPVSTSKDTASVNVQADLPSLSYQGTDKVNFVRTYDILAPYTSFPTGSSFSTAINNGNILQATQYFDGLGRPIQTVARQASGTGKDMVSFFTYDEYGRQVYQPMGYEATTSNGSMQLSPTSAQSSFLNGHYADEDVFYGKTDFEASPLNRPQKQMAPGNSWVGQGRGISTEYLSNAAGVVRLWDVSGTDPVTTNTYAAGELSLIKTTDENGNVTKEYTDLRGRVILKDVSGKQTYYLYDEHDNLKYVLPPRATEILSANNWSWDNVDELVFTYTYDHRKRMITKKVPGAGEVHMVYDKLDRLVLTQDANQRAMNQWTFTKYDQLNRPVMTGHLLPNPSKSRTEMQSLADNWSGIQHVSKEGISAGAHIVEGTIVEVDYRDTGVTLYRTKSTGYIDFVPGFDGNATDGVFDTETTLALSHEYIYYQGYYDATFPMLSDSIYQDFTMLTLNYYDDYDWTSKTFDSSFNSRFNEVINANAITPAQYSNSKGLATGSKVRVLNSDQWLSTAMFYDDRGRVIQTHADNHLGGTDISTTQYDFSGRVLQTYTQHDNPLAQDHGDTRILKSFTYDNQGRLLTIQEKLNDTGSFKTLSTHTYNALGELSTKALGADPITPSNPLETLNFDYNVRGWMSSINGDYVEGTSTNHYFGMELSYDHGFTNNQYNGNIAGIQWKSKSSDKERAYGFTYDNLNRLTVADYNQYENSTWSKDTADFSTSYDYDANGNILSLTRKGVVAGSIETIDNLSYNYDPTDSEIGPANQLFAVTDIAGNMNQGDFKDGNTSGDDYSYDGNGNMKSDANKGISTITYNHLNLPVTVSFTGNRTITYVYDAAGIKLQKIANDNGTITTTDYVGGFIYENNKLQHFAHEEGRTRPDNANPNNLVYDYFIKDHLGNTRMTLTESTDEQEYRATMETGISQGVDIGAYEESLFLNIADLRDSTTTGANTTDVPDIADDKTVRLNGSDAYRRIGPAKVFAVSAGDQIDVSVDGYYTGTYSNTGAQTQTTMAAALSTVLSTGTANATEQSNITSLINGLPASSTVYIGTAGDQSKPKAYLNVIVFDQDFEAIDGGFAQVDQAGHTTLSITKTLNQGGYVYVYLSNESQTDFDIYFDNLQITHTKGRILQEDHYYPFGGSIAALSSNAPLSKPNRYKYSGKEEQTEFDLNWYDYGARNYDAQLGRWFNVDPLAESYYSISPYVYVANAPLLLSDPNGREISFSYTRNDDGELTGINIHITGTLINESSRKLNQKQLERRRDRILKGLASIKVEGSDLDISVTGDIDIANTESDIEKSDHVFRLVDEVGDIPGGKSADPNVDSEGFAPFRQKVIYLENDFTDRIVAHEFGHSAGLKHINQTSIRDMFPYAHKDVSGRSRSPGVSEAERRMYQQMVYISFTSIFTNDDYPGNLMHQGASKNSKGQAVAGYKVTIDQVWSIIYNIENGRINKSRQK